MVFLEIGTLISRIMKLHLIVLTFFHSQLQVYRLPWMFCFCHTIQILHRTIVTFILNIQTSLSEILLFLQLRVYRFPVLIVFLKILSLYLTTDFNLHLYYFVCHKIQIINIYSHSCKEERQ